MIYRKKFNIFHMIGFHKLTKCVESQESFEMNWRPVVDPFSVFTLIETRYKCTECGRKFWMPKGDFEMQKMYEQVTYTLQGPSEGDN